MWRIAMRIRGLNWGIGPVPADHTKTHDPFKRRILPALCACSFACFQFGPANGLTGLLLVVQTFWHIFALWWNTSCDNTGCHLSLQTLAIRKSLWGGYNWAVDHNAQWRVSGAFNARGKYRNPDYDTWLEWLENYTDRGWVSSIYLAT